MSKKSYGGVLITDSLLNQLSIREMLNSEGCEGLGMLYYVLCYLKKCYHSIGILDKHSIHTIAMDARKHDKTIKAFIMDWGIFRIVGNGRFFVFPYFRKNFGFTVDITEREQEVIDIYGNGITSEPEEYTAEHPLDEDASARNSASSGNGKVVNKGLKSARKTLYSEKQTSQDADNEDVTHSLYTNDKVKGMGIIRKGNNNPIPTTSNVVSNVDNAAAEAEEISCNFLEKKLNQNKEWVNSTSKTRCINLEDEKIMHIFAEWMYNYCISNNSMPSELSKIQHYASCLLTKGLRTRKNFDAYLAEKTEECPAKGRVVPGERMAIAPKNVVNSGVYEQRINGERIGLGGEKIPIGAPLLVKINDRWSAIQGKFIDVSVWNKKREDAYIAEIKRKKEEEENAKRQAIIDNFIKTHPEVRSNVRDTIPSEDEIISEENDRPEENDKGHQKNSKKNKLHRHKKHK